ncbi:hypothetical protein [Streptomyces sp. NPDC058579]|uniref:hypothetical protein n=1 Tax=Streptomyces sp. NPDC058579 TaxID=3346548 RepID=UPI00364A7305
MTWYPGPSRITVIGVDADWPQRAVVLPAGGGRRIVIPGVVGESVDIGAAGCHMNLEHQYQGSWRPNVRTLQGRWDRQGGIEVQVIRSKDHDWSHDRVENDLVLRIERLVQAPDTAAAAAQAPSGLRDSSPAAAARSERAPSDPGRISTVSTDTPAFASPKASPSGSPKPSAKVSGRGRSGRPATPGRDSSG